MTSKSEAGEHKQACGHDLLLFRPSLYPLTLAKGIGPEFRSAAVWAPGPLDARLPGRIVVQSSKAKPSAAGVSLRG